MNKIAAVVITLLVVTGIAVLTIHGRMNKAGIVPSPIIGIPTVSSPSMTPVSIVSAEIKTFISIKINTLSYDPSDTIAVAIWNQSNKSIYFWDSHTNCTVIQLQQKLNGAWKPIDNCGLAIMSVLHTLAAGATLSIHLTPPLTPPHNSWSSGSYRATLQYGLDNTNPTTNTAISAVFQIQ